LREMVFWKLPGDKDLRFLSRGLLSKVPCTDNSSLICSLLYSF
jgi:hypothetical protein